jgi:hypothetical protein
MAGSKKESKMFRVMYGMQVYTAVAEINGKWIDGVTGHNVTKGKKLGTFLGSNNRGGERYEYYRLDGSVYVLHPDGKFVWLCDCAVEKTFEKHWKN